ncbi:hypothetical protein [Vibrio crassostreae]|uniref:hypothetical protein n=1 Tax=Vibrio crassostreae TaxID=246167 RepID=UPI001B30D66E|nr:hypothetical protein [Vibrio crassostreae]
MRILTFALLMVVSAATVAEPSYSDEAKELVRQWTDLDNCIDKVGKGRLATSLPDAEKKLVLCMDSKKKSNGKINKTESKQ